MEDNEARPDYEPELAEPATPLAQAKYSSVQRLWMMFTSPDEVFSDIRIKPSWILILVALVILGIGYQAVVIPHLDIEGTVRARVAEEGAQISDEQFEGAVKFASLIARLAPIIVPPVAIIIVALFYFLMLKIVESDTSYEQAFSTALHGYWPPTVVGLALTSILVQRIGMVQEEELANVVKANVGAFMSADAPAWLTAALGTLSIFNVWAVILLIMGFASVGKISKGKAAVVTLVPWGVWIAAKAGIAAIFS